MSWYYYKPYISAAQRRANAQREAAKLTKKGKSLAPVLLEGRKIASTFWGKAWCENLESYSDFSNRLPRGRTYVRNGSVIDLQIEQGRIIALVSGSEIYKIEIRITPLAAAAWNRVQTDCAGKIDSLIGLLQGKLSPSVMEVVTSRDKGLFPNPREIKMDCSCPDWAGMCKHLAACLYGIGARLDHQPELLFLLRGIDPSQLISSVSAASAIAQTNAPAAQLDDGDLASIFGIDIEGSAPVAVSPAPAATPRKAKSKVAKKPVARKRRAR